jgi:hypothetical protein
MKRTPPRDPFAALRSAGAKLPACPASTDPSTSAAIRSFEMEFGAGMPAELAMRLIRDSEMPASLLGALLERKDYVSREAAQRGAERFMALWNHTPRAELGDRTPDQVASRRG